MKPMPSLSPAVAALATFATGGFLGIMPFLDWKPPGGLIWALEAVFFVCSAASLWMFVGWLREAREPLIERFLALNSGAALLWAELVLCVGGLGAIALFLDARTVEQMQADLQKLEACERVAQMVMNIEYGLVPTLSKIASDPDAGEERFGQATYGTHTLSSGLYSACQFTSSDLSRVDKALASPPPPPSPADLDEAMRLVKPEGDYKKFQSFARSQRSAASIGSAAEKLYLELQTKEVALRNKISRRQSTQP